MYANVICVLEVYTIPHNSCFWPKPKVNYLPIRLYGESADDCNSTIFMVQTRRSYEIEAPRTSHHIILKNQANRRWGRQKSGFQPLVDLDGSWIPIEISSQKKQLPPWKQTHLLENDGWKMKCACSILRFQGTRRYYIVWRLGMFLLPLFEDVGWELRHF